MYYKDFNNALKETIGEFVNLDKRKKAGGDAENQKLKFNEIINRKQKDSNADISDLWKKL